MNRKSGNRYDYVARGEDELAEDISHLKTYSERINQQLRQECITFYDIEKTRTGLEQYLDAGTEALRKTNAILT